MRRTSLPRGGRTRRSCTTPLLDALGVSVTVTPGEVGDGCTAISKPIPGSFDSPAWKVEGDQHIPKLVSAFERLAEHVAALDDDEPRFASLAAALNEARRAPEDLDSYLYTHITTTYGIAGELAPSRTTSSATTSPSLLGSPRQPSPFLESASRTLRYGAGQIRRGNRRSAGDRLRRPLHSLQSKRHTAPGRSSTAQIRDRPRSRSRASRVRCLVARSACRRRTALGRDCWPQGQPQTSLYSQSDRRERVSHCAGEDPPWKPGDRRRSSGIAFRQVASGAERLPVARVVAAAL